MSDPLKDLQNLKDLFPDMESYVPTEEEQKESDKVERVSDEAKSKMRLYVLRDKKHRGGKQVTLVEGFDGPEEAMQELHSKLKSLCSAGGSLKDGEMMIQGNHVRKVIDFLIKAGYKQVKQKGG